MQEKIEQGRQVQREMLGDEFVDKVIAGQRPGTFGAYVSKHAQAYCFGDIWSRPQLDRRSRSIATIAMLVGLRTPAELKNHITAGLNNGLSVEEIEEILLQAVPYLGYPTTAVALKAAREVLKELGRID